MSTFGPAIRLKSVTFRESVRFPGSGISGHYIPSEDYPIVYYPQCSMVEARLKEGVQPMPNHVRRHFYAWASVKDCQVIEESLPPETAVTTNEQGVLTVPTARMKIGAGGSFERVTDEELAAEVAASEPVEAPAPEPRKKPGPKAKPKAKATAAPFIIRPQAEPPAPRTPEHAATIVNTPRARVTNLGPGGGA